MCLSLQLPTNIIDIIRKGLETGRFNTNQQVPSMYGNKMAESMDCDAVTVVGNLL